MIAVSRLDGPALYRAIINSEYVLLLKGGWAFAFVEVFLPAVCPLLGLLILRGLAMGWRLGMA